MSNNLEDEFGQTSDPTPASEQDFREWELGLLRGVGARTVGAPVTRVDSRGNRINEVTVVDDEYATPVQRPAAAHAAECACAACQQQAFRYMTWHQSSHRHVPNPQCRICQAQAKFRQEHPELIGKRVGIDGFQQ
jgi:hypothetical protein